MKKLLFFTALLSVSIAMTPIQDNNLSAITSAISSGNADALGKFFDTNVEVAVKDTEKTYSKNEAINVLKGFFAKNKPSSFKQVHQGASKGQDSKYVIGNLAANTGSFRVYVFIKTNNGSSVIQEIRFD